MISGVVIAKNEQDLIETCLKSLKWCDELLVVLNDSTDKTKDVAKKYTNKILKVSGQDFSKVRNVAMDEAKGDWVLYVDADERVLEPLQQELLVLVQSSEYNAFAISRKNIIYGYPVSYGPYQSDWMIRLFKKSSFKKWVGRVHEHGEFEGKLGYSKHSFLHLTHRDLDHVILKSLDWSHIDAKLRFDAHHPKMTSWRFLRILLTELFNQGVKRKGFFNGDVGTIDALLQTFSLLMTYIRLWQLQQSPTIDEKYEALDQKLLENGFKYP
jgi:glycosyltransferase involved in cell wall biosynthesis